MQRTGNREILQFLRTGGAFAGEIKPAVDKKSKTASLQLAPVINHRGNQCVKLYRPFVTCQEHFVGFGKLL